MRKPDLKLIHGGPVMELPDSALEEFKSLIDEGMKPSVAVKRVMSKRDISQLDPSVVYCMVRFAYPNVEVNRFGISFKIADSNYPDSDSNQFSDDDFDNEIQKVLDAPDPW